MKKDDNELLLGAGAAIVIGLLGMAINNKQPEANVAQSKPCGCNKH